MYGWDLCPGTAMVSEKAYKEPWKLANEAMITHRLGKHRNCGQVLNLGNNGLSRIDFMGRIYLISLKSMILLKTRGSKQTKVVTLKLN